MPNFFDLFMMMLFPWYKKQEPVKIKPKLPAVHGHSGFAQ